VPIVPSGGSHTKQESEGERDTGRKLRFGNNHRNWNVQALKRGEKASRCRESTARVLLKEKTGFPREATLQSTWQPFWLEKQGLKTCKLMERREVKVTGERSRDESRTLREPSVTCR